MKQQLTLWDEPPTPAHHGLIEVHYQGGERRLICTQSREDAAPRLDEIYAGYVYPIPQSSADCPVCRKRKGGK